MNIVNDMHLVIGRPADVEENIRNMKRVLRLVEEELARALTKHPVGFHNAHEGHSVIREEFDTELWEHVCHDTAYTVDGMMEAIQTAAMAVRFVVDLHNHPQATTACRTMLL